jgi:glutathione synthase/RimK-type ligase-like ATP-grasp enzyme
MDASIASSCAIVNAGGGAWAFEEHAHRLARALWLEVRETAVDYLYLLAWDGPEPPPCREMFIRYEAILAASDKRRLAELFERHSVAVPRTYVLESEAQVRRLAEREPDTEWVLKWPTGCGASGHRLLRSDVPIPRDWPQPYLLQEFVRMESPEVYRLYCVAGETFGWNVRRFPPGGRSSPWVAHAQGARYENAGPAPEEAEHEARRALSAAGLLSSFGCADLLRDSRGKWLVLEVNTDGVFNHVDRDIRIAGLPEEIDRRLAEAFWTRVGHRPWGDAAWKPRPG